MDKSCATKRYKTFCGISLSADRGDNELDAACDRMIERRFKEPMDKTRHTDKITPEILPFGERLRMVVLKFPACSQAELSKKVGVAPCQINRWIGGHAVPSTGNVMKMVQAVRYRYKDVGNYKNALAFLLDPEECPLDNQAPKGEVRQGYRTRKGKEDIYNGKCEM